MTIRYDQFLKKKKQKREYKYVIHFDAGNVFDELDEKGVVHV